MSEPIRIVIRIAGLVLFVASLAGVALIIGLGADEAGERMGQNCRHNNQLGPSEQCTWQDALSIMQALPYTCLVGAVLLLIGHPRSGVAVGAGPGDGSSGPRTGSIRDRVGAFGLLAVVALVVLTFGGTFIYRAGYTAVTIGEVAKEIAETPGPDLSRKPADRPARTPRGLTRRSLLREKAFRAAVAEIRRAAPSGARLSGLRVAADRIDAEVIGAGRVVDIVKPWDGKAKVESDAPRTELDTVLVSFSRLDRSAPQRAAIAATRPRGLRTTAVDYIVLQNITGLRWRAFLR